MNNDRQTEETGFHQFSIGGEIRQPAQVGQSVGYAIRRAQMRVYDDFFTTLADHDTTPARYTLMLLIRENPGIRSVDLARTLGVARSRMVKLIDDLERRALISRRTRRDDRRNQALVLTAQGERVLLRIDQDVERHEARLTNGLSESERERLIGLLRRVGAPDPASST